jgi:hypothetical protein
MLFLNQAFLKVLTLSTGSAWIFQLVMHTLTYLVPEGRGLSQDSLFITVKRTPLVDFRI